MDTTALAFWKKDVAKSLLVQWGLLVVVSGVCVVWSLNAGLSALLSGLSVAIPNTALGAWMGLRIALGKLEPAGVLIGGFLKTLLSMVLISAAFAVLQEFGWVWQGFFAGLVSMVFAPVVFGLTLGRSV